MHALVLARRNEQGQGTRVKRQEILGGFAPIAFQSQPAIVATATVLHWEICKMLSGNVLWVFGEHSWAVASVGVWG